MSAHTPEPWTTDQLFEADGYKVRRILASNGCPLATLQHCAEDAPNARLMATAPKLLAALIELHRICRDCDMERPVGECEPPTEEEYEAAMVAAEAAIAQATGDAA